MTNTPSRWLPAFQRAFRAWPGDRFSSRPFGAIYLGCETQTVAAEYRWDGLRRGADPRHPRIMFQATLDGWGRFERGSRRWIVGPESAFLAVLPSRHLYLLPPESPRWSFFWFTFAHPYVVQRLAGLVKRYPPIFALPAGAPLVAESLSFFERCCHGRFDDPFAEEAALLDWMLELERHLHDLAHPRGRREAALEDARRATLAGLPRAIGVGDLARRHGLSRSHFSHRFRGATGLTPGAFMHEVRLGEVRRRLRETREPLKEIAGATGFADANHLCKAFRRRYHLSPGTYRYQMR